MSHNVLFVDCAQAHGGAQRSLFTLIIHLDRERFTPHLLCANDALNGLLRQCRKKDIRSGYVNIRTWRRNATGVHHAVVDLMKAKPILKRWLQKHKIDLVYANGIQAGLLCSMAIPKHLPMIYHCRDYQCPTAAMKKVVKRAEKTIMVSDFVRRHWAELLPDYAERMVRIYNGFDFSIMDRLRQLVDYRESRGCPPDMFIVSMIADLVRWKRHDLFLESLAKLVEREPRAFGFIIGSPRDEEGESYEQELLAQAERLGITQNVAFTGHVENPFPLIDASNVMVSVAENEPFGRNVVESLFCQKPLVIVPGGGPAEIAADSEAAIVAEPQPEALADALLTWQQADEERLQAAGTAAEAAARRYDLDTHVNAISDLITSCTANA